MSSLSADRQVIELEASSAATNGLQPSHLVCFAEEETFLEAGHQESDSVSE